MAITQHVSELRETLSGLLEMHQSLVQAAKEMNRALKEQNAAEVKRASACYDELTCHVEQLEEQRLETCDALCQELSSPVEHTALSAIIEVLGKERSNGLPALRDQLKLTLAELIRVNASNQVLLEESLEMFGKTLDMLARSGSKPVGYQRQGAARNVQDARILINKTA